MKKYFVFAALLLAAAVSCNKEVATDDVIVPKKGYVQITLNANCDAEAKAALDGNKVVWSVGEEVAVFPGSATTAEKFTVKTVDGSSVTITGAVPEGTTTLVAAYPYKNVVSRSSSVVTMKIGDQTISGTAKVDPDALSSVAYFESLEATPTFYNTVALLSFQVAQEGITKVSFAPVTGAFGGSVEVTASASAAPGVSVPTTPATSGSEAVSVSCADGFAVGTTYYAAVAPGTFSGLEVSSTMAGKSSKKSSEKGSTLNRGGILPLGDVTPDGNWKFGVITNAQELKAFLADAANYVEGDEVELGNDIDCSGVEIVSADSFAGTFDGKGFKIKNWTSVINDFYKVDAETGETVVAGKSCSLFATNSGVIQNLIIDSTCKIDWQDPIPDMTGVSFIVAKANTGTIKDCQVAGNIVVSTAEAGRIYCAGVVGESTTGTVENCKFNGSIDVTLSGTSASCSAIAGVAGRVGTKEMTDISIVKNCTNEGSIKFLFSGPSGNMKKFGVGGVIGQTPSVANAPEDHGTIEGCINKGSISWEYEKGGSGSYPCMGGVAGIIEGKIKDCTNNGSITYKGSKTTAATDPNFGGVAGYVTRGAYNCVNNGQIIIDAGLAGGTAGAQSGGNTKYVQIGGVFGGAGEFITDNSIDYDKFPSTKDNGIKIEKCINNAALNLTPSMVQSGGPKMSLGGVVGASTAEMEDCHNNKDITIKSNTRWIFAGGLAGIANGNVTNCTSTGQLTVDADKDNHPSGVAKQQHYVGGLFGYVIKTSELSNCQNSKAVSLVNVYTTASALSYLGGIMGSYSGGITMTNCSNSGSVTFDADDPICLGGVAGAFNGTMNGTSNTGKVENKSTYTAEGKEAEVGGLVGYANATFTGCTNKGSVSSASPDGATGGLVGGFGEAEKTWSDCLVDAPVSGPNAGSIFGWFRKDTEHTITIGAEGAPFTVSANATVNGSAPTVNNIVGNIKSGHTDNVNLIIAGSQVVDFTEDLTNKKFTYAGKEYPIVKMQDGRWWMAKNLAYLPSGMTPATSLTAVTAGVFAPVKVNADQTALEFTTDESVIASNGYLYQAEVALGLKVGDITSESQARALEGAQGICPPGWYVPTLSDLESLVGNGGNSSTVNKSAPYYNVSFASMSMLNADGFGMDAFGAISIQNTTRTEGTFMGWASGYPNKISSGMFCGSSFAGITYKTAGDSTSGILNVQFFGFMPMTNKAAETDYTCNGTKVSYRIAGPLRCIRKAE